MMMYEIEIGTKYGFHYTYVKCDNVNGLCKYLNERRKKYPDNTIIEVKLAPNYNKTGKIVKFLPLEMNTQKFIESYEERLLETYKMNTLLV